jgi:hypothetical protein
MASPILLPSGATVALPAPGPAPQALPAPGPTAVTVTPVQGVPGIQGPSGDSNPVIGETPGGAVDGVNTTLNPFVAGSLSVYVGGLLQRAGVDYQESGSHAFVFLGTPPQTGDQILIDYLVAT